MVATISGIQVEELVPFFKKWKIVEASLFEDEDDGPGVLNFLVVFAEDAPWGLFAIVRMQDELSELTGRRAQIATKFGILHSTNANLSWARRVLESAKLFYAE